MRWFNRYNFPYSNFHDLNLDWLLQEMTRIREEWEQVKAEWEQMKIDWQEFQERMERLWQEYKDLMNRLWAEFKAQLEGEWEDYQRQMDEAWELYQQELNQAWATYQQTVNNRLDAQDTKIENLESAWATYQQTVNQILASMQTQIDNFISQMEAYIRQQLPGIAEPIIQDWLDGIDPASLILDDLPIITPEMFGAVGDGTTDDLNAFISMFNASSGKVVLLAPGKHYHLSAPLSPGTLPSTIIGNEASIDNDLTLDGIDPIAIENLRLPNNNLTLTRFQYSSITGGRYGGISVTHTPGLVIDGVMAGSISSFDQESPINISNCDLNPTTGNPITLSGTKANLSNIILRGTISVSNQQTGASASSIKRCDVNLDNIMIENTATSPVTLLATFSVASGGDSGVNSKITIGNVISTTNNIAGMGYGVDWTVNNAGNFNIARVNYSAI